MVSRFVVAGALAVVCSLLGVAEAAQVDVNEQQVKAWNRFSEVLFNLHKQQLAGREIRKTEHSGRYGGEAAKKYSFRDVNYYDADTGRLLSYVRWDGEKPDVYHIVEVFVYDAAGRLVRDFSSIYLPWARNAPIRTFVNLHRHNGELHAYRQFDASGRRLYEQCRGRVSGKAVDISLEYQDITAQATAAPTYKDCFSALPDTAGAYLTPQ
jgi:hypothetical protein